MKSTFSFYDIYKVILKHVWVVIISIIVCLGGLLVLSRTPVESQYQADTQVLVYPTKQNFINFATLADVVRSKDVLKRTMSKYNKTVDREKLKYSEFRDMVSTSGNGGSQVITISVAESTGKSAKKISRYLSESFVKVVKENLPVRSHVNSILNHKN